MFLLGKTNWDSRLRSLSLQTHESQFLRGRRHANSIQMSCCSPVNFQTEKEMLVTPLSPSAHSRTFHRLHMCLACREKQISANSSIIFVSYIDIHIDFIPVYLFIYYIYWFPPQFRKLDFGIKIGFIPTCKHKEKEYFCSLRCLPLFRKRYLHFYRCASGQIWFYICNMNIFQKDLAQEN